MARKNNSKSKNVANTVDATNTAPENVNVDTATVETPATETPAKGSKSKGKAAPKLSDFKVIRTVEVSPLQVELVKKFRGRAKLATEEVITDLADSMRTKGQQQAIQVREKASEPGKFEAVFGNTRELAALAILNGYTTDSGKKEVAPNPAFKIRCEVVECDDETARIANIIENAHRQAVSPIGNALNQVMLRDEMGMSDVTIAKLYNYSSSASVSRLKKLLELEDEYQNSVEDGTLSQAAAFLLADVPEGEPRKTVWLACVDKCKGEDSIGSTPMVEAIKAWRKADKEAKATQTADKPAGESGTVATAPEGQPGTVEGTVPGWPSGNEPTKTYALTLKQFKDLVTAIASDSQCPAKVAEGMSVILSTLSGETADRDFAQWFVTNLKNS